MVRHPAPGPTAEDFVLGLTRLVDGIFSTIDALGDLFAELVRRDPTGHPPLRRLHSLRAHASAGITAHSGLVAGMGVVAAPGLLGDVRRGLAWWHVGAGGRLARLDVDLDPESVGEYDYTAADWFALPRHGARRAVVGPYVDYSGVNDYIVTLTVPTEHDGEFLGVAGADVPIKSIEAQLPPLSRALGRQAVLVNTDGRILASTSPRLFVGSVLRGIRLASGGQQVGPETGEANRFDVPGLPWALIVLP